MGLRHILLIIFNMVIEPLEPPEPPLEPLLQIIEPLLQSKNEPLLQIKTQTFHRGGSRGSIRN